jgi:hypothetical protein
MPLSTLQSSARGTPPGLLGNSGSMIDHAGTTRAEPKFSVVKLYPSKLRQIGVAKTEPGDENNQDISALVGKIDIRKLEQFSQHDPDAYSFSGGLNRTTWSGCAAGVPSASRGRCVWARSSAVLEASAFVAGLDDVAMVREPVEHGHGEARERCADLFERSEMTGVPVE